MFFLFYLRLGVLCISDILLQLNRKCRLILGEHLPRLWMVDLKIIMLISVLRDPIQLDSVLWDPIQLNSVLWEPIQQEERIAKAWLCRVEYQQILFQLMLPGHGLCWVCLQTVDGGKLLVSFCDMQTSGFTPIVPLLFPLLHFLQICFAALKAIKNWDL